MMLACLAPATLAATARADDPLPMGPMLPGPMLHGGAPIAAPYMPPTGYGALPPGYGAIPSGAMPNAT